jgi:hypothetical protein
MSGDSRLTFISSIARSDSLKVRSSRTRAPFVSTRGRASRDRDVHDSASCRTARRARRGCGRSTPERTRPGCLPAIAVRLPEVLTGPSAVELHELGAVPVQDVGGHDALGAALRQHHDHRITRTNIRDVVRQVLELLEVKGTISTSVETARGIRVRCLSDRDD